MIFIDKTINIGVVGIGYWGPNYVRIFNEIPNVNVKWVCDNDKSKLDRINQKHQIKKTTKYEDILKDKDIDAIIISTPTKTHYSLTKKALLNNKHVLVEKPITTSSKEALELNKISNKKNKVLMVGHIFEYNSAVRKMKEYISSKELGEILYVHSSRTGLGPIRQDVNAIWDLATHDVSVLLYLLNKKPLSVVAKGQSYIQKGVEDVVFATIAFEGKVIANIHVSWLDPVKIRKMTLVGTKKMVVFDDVSPLEKLRIFDKGVSYEKPGSTFGDFQLLVRDGDINIPKIKFNEPLKEECLHFLDCIKNNKKPLTDSINGYKVVKILEAMQESLNNNSKVVYIKE